jgi:hypothetical protein
LTGAVKLINPPSRFDKIHLTSSRPKFVVTGTKDSIFDWMQLHGKLACVFDQEAHTQFMSHPKPRRHSHEYSRTNEFKISFTESPNVTITFELHCEEEHHHRNQHNLIKKIFSSSGTKKYNGSTKMRLEINACNYDEINVGPLALECENQNPIMKAKSPSGVKLQQVLKTWINHEKSKMLSDHQRSKDFE